MVQMKLVNSTCYSTRDLKKLFTRIAAAELNPDKAKQVVFKIKYWRMKRTGGCAFVGGTQAVLKVPHPDKHKLDMPAVAKTIAHEMAHLRGLRHGADMHCSRYSWNHGDYRKFYAWANDYTIGIKQPKKTTTPIKSIVSARQEHAQKMLDKNVAKLKRTQALVKKWEAKVRYYDKKTMAAGA